MKKNYKIKDEKIIERKGKKIRKYKKWAGTENDGMWISKSELYKGK